MMRTEEQLTQTEKILPKVVVGIALFIAIGFTIVLAVPTGWHIKVTQVWSFYVGLFNVKVRADTIIGGTMKKLTKGVAKGVGAKKSFDSLLGSIDGDNTIQFYRDQMCNVEMAMAGVLNNCQVWTNLMYGSYAAACGLLISIVCLLVGATLMFMPPSRCQFLSTLACFGAAAIVSISSLGGYMVLSYGFQDWLSGIYGSHRGLTFSTCSFVAGMLALASVSLPITVASCAKKRGEEDDIREQRMMFGDDPFAYGSFGPPPPPLPAGSGTGMNDPMSGPPDQQGYGYGGYQQTAADQQGSGYGGYQQSGGPPDDQGYGGYQQTAGSPAAYQGGQAPAYQQYQQY